MTSKKTEMDIEDKLLIGILSRKLKAGYSTESLVFLVMNLCGTLQEGIDKEKKKK